MSDDLTGQTPAYIGRCPECNGMVAAAVAPVDEPQTMRDALKSRGQWERSGLKVSTGIVNDVRTCPADDWGHRDGCVTGERRKRRRRRS